MMRVYSIRYSGEIMYMCRTMTSDTPETPTTVRHPSVLNLLFDNFTILLASFLDGMSIDRMSLV